MRVVAASATIGSFAVEDVARVSRTASVGAAREALASGGRGYAGDLAITDDDSRLLGAVPVEALLTARADRPVVELMVPAEPSARPQASSEHLAHRIAHSAARAAWVVDEHDRLLGVVPPDRIAAILVAEHDEDMARLGGYRAHDRSAREAAEEPLGPRLHHRLPWLLIGLAGAMASTLIVSAFEEQLKQVVLLSFFVPAVVYMADSVGTQTETVLIRAMAAGVGVRDVYRRELLTGLTLGLLIAALFFPFAVIGWGDTEVAAAVAAALMASCSIATAVAMALPAAFQRLGRDPAFGSGPLATVVQDLLSIALYFAIAVPIAT